MKKRSPVVGIRAVVVELLGLFVLVWLVMPAGPPHEKQVVVPTLQIPPAESTPPVVTPAEPADHVGQRHTYVARQLDYHAAFFWKLLSRHFKQALNPDRQIVQDHSAANDRRDH